MENLPAGLVPIEIATTAIKYTTLSCAYAGSLVVPLGLLLLYCPKPVRRTPVFPILTVLLLLGIIWAFLSFAQNMRSVKQPLNAPIRGIFLGSSSLNFLIPIFTDTVLIFKLLWLFPSFQYARWQRALLVALPTLLFIPRVVIISFFLDHAGRIYDNQGGIEASVAYLSSSKLPLTEFCMQLVSNAYCSGVLLIKAYFILNGPGESGSTHRSQAITKRLQTMLRVLASSFLIPVIIQIILVGSFAGTQDPWIREPIQWTNTYISLHCAVLATVWSAIGDSLHSRHADSSAMQLSGSGARNSTTQTYDSDRTYNQSIRHSQRTKSLSSVDEEKGHQGTQTAAASNSTPYMITERIHITSPSDNAAALPVANRFQRQVATDDEPQNISPRSSGPFATGWTEEKL